MREAEFRAWLGQRLYNGTPLTTVANRIGWVKAAERALPNLGFAEATLDEVHASGGWKELLQALSRLRSDWRSNEAAAKAIAPRSADPHLQAANARQAVGMYGRFLDGDDPNYADTEGDGVVQVVPAPGSDRPFVLYDSEGNEYQPTRTVNRETGVPAFHLKRPGTGNRADDAEKVDEVIDVARAMLIDGRLARLMRTDGIGKPSYIGYGKKKMVSYHLDAKLASRIGVPPLGGVDGVSGRQTTDHKEQGAMPQLLSMPTNLILYGPPGTGKTYRTALEAVKLCEPSASYPDTREGRAALMADYHQLVRQERIGFVTFHQNYGYEDFVEGMRPTTYGEDGEPLASGFRLAPEAGIFTKIAERAEALRSSTDEGYDFTGKRFFKMSLGEVANPEDDYLFDEAIEGGFVHMGDDGGMDWSEPRFNTKEAMIDGYAERHPELPRQHPNNGIIEFPYRLRVRARVGDIIIVSKGNLLFRAIGEVTGEYHQVERENDDYTMRRPVKWLWIDREGVSHDLIYGKRFSQRTIYEMTDAELKLDAVPRCCRL